MFATTRPAGIVRALSARESARSFAGPIDVYPCRIARQLRIGRFDQLRHRKTVFDNHVFRFRTNDLEYASAIEMATSTSAFLEKCRDGKAKEIRRSAVIRVAVQRLRPCGDEPSRLALWSRHWASTGASLYAAFGDKHLLYPRAANTMPDVASPIVLRVSKTIFLRGAIAVLPAE